MKNFLLKILFLISFILIFISGAIAEDTLGIQSVTFDNSGTFFSINSFDVGDMPFTKTPKLFIIPEDNKAYFDIEPAVMNTNPVDLVLGSGDVREVIVKQFSNSPDIVRVVVKYNDGFNPKNIQLKKINNSLFVRLKTTQCQNFYFQQVFSQVAADVPEIYESTSIQTPILASQNMLNQINSSIKLGSTTEDKNYILAKKDLILPTKYFLDDISVRSNNIYFYGIGAFTISKPFILSNPTRIVYDIPNATVNPAIRNKDIYISEKETIKAGQFDQRTARIVITSADAHKYIPVISSDNQRFLIVNKDSVILPNSFVSYSIFTNMSDEIAEDSIHSIKLFFSKPIVYSVVKDDNSIDVYLYNVEKYGDFNLKKLISIDGAKITNNKNKGIIFSLPLEKEDVVDIHSGIDSKTLRIKVKLNNPKHSKTTTRQEEPLPVKIDHHGKIYVVLDAGHGGSDHGAIRGNISEKDITLDITKRVEKLLTKKGYEVFMTRTGDETVTLQDRVDISENVQPDIFVSIHVNSSNSSAPKGIETHYYKDNSLILAKTIHAAMLNNINTADRGLFKSKFYVINHTTAPAVLVEIGFMSNDTERAQIVSESRKQATAKAIAEGINEYFKK